MTACRTCNHCQHWIRLLGTGLGRCNRFERYASAVHHCPAFSALLLPVTPDLTHPTFVPISATVVHSTPLLTG